MAAETLMGSWRACQAERCIRMARHTLSHQLTITNELPYTVLETVVLEVVWLINTKPIAVKYTAEDDVVAICPNDILLGRSHRLRPELATLPQIPNFNLLNFRTRASPGLWNTRRTW